MTKDSRDDSIDRLLQQSLRARADLDGPVCPDAETLAAWIDDSLPPGERAHVERHVADCTRCQTHLATAARIEAHMAPSTESRRGVAWWRWLVPASAGATALALWLAMPPARAPVPAAPPAPEAPRPNAELAAPAAAPTAAAPAPAPTAQAPSAARFQDRALAKEGHVQRNEPPAEKKAAVEQSFDAAAAAPPEARVGAAEAHRMESARSATVLEERVATRFIVAAPQSPIRWRVLGANIEVSMDGGATWTSQPTGVDVSWTAGSSPASGVAWLVGRHGAVLLTTDGRSWRRVGFPEPVDLVRVVATDSVHASVTAADGRSFSTADGGITWVLTPLQDFSAPSF